MEPRPRLSRYSEAVSPALSQVLLPPQSISTALSPQTAATHWPWPTSSTVTELSSTSVSRAYTSTTISVQTAASDGASGLKSPFPLSAQARAKAR